MTIQERTPPAKYKVGEINYRKELFIWIMITGSVLCVIGLILSLMLLMSLEIIDVSEDFQITINPISLFIIIIVLGCLHEGIHGLGFKFYGKKTKYGFKLMYNVFPVFYANSKGLFSRNQLIIVCLAPCFLITAILSGILAITLSQKLVWISLFLIVTILAHIFGCGGDFYITYRLLKFPSTIIIEDSGEEEDPLIIWNDSVIPIQKQVSEHKSSFIIDFKNVLYNDCKNLVFFVFLVFCCILVGLLIFGLLIPVILKLLLVEEFEFIGFQYISTSNGIRVINTHFLPLLVISFFVTVLLIVLYKSILNFKQKKEKADSSEDQNVGIPFLI